MAKSPEILSRRDALKTLGLFTGGALLASCAPQEPELVIPQYTPALTSTPSPESTPTKEPSVTPEPTSTETPRYQLEDGTQMERLEGNKLNEIFPTSEIYTSEREDIVVIDRKMKVDLAGQRIKTKNGDLVFLFSKAYYQRIWESVLESNTGLGGYADFRDLTPKDEIGRILLTLAGIKYGETSLGGHLRTYNPRKKNFIYIQGNLGESTWFARMLPDRLFDPEKTYREPDGSLSPVLRIDGNNYIQMAATTPAVYKLSSGENPDEWLTEFLGGQFVRNTMYRMVRSMVSTIGYDTVEFFNRYSSGFNGILVKSPFSPLFSHPEIYKALGGELNAYEPPYPLEKMAEYQVASKFGIKSLIEIDLTRFK